MSDAGPGVLREAQAVALPICRAPALTDYNRHPLPWEKAWLWQYTGDGVGPLPHNVPGIGRNMDINHYAGSDEELAARWAR